MLKLTGMTDCAPIRTPIDPNVKLGAWEDSPPVNHFQYQQFVGKLLYLTRTRPEISFAIHHLSQFMHAPHEIHHHAANRVLAYLKGCPGTGLCFPPSTDETVRVYTDADFFELIVDYRSTTRYCTFLFGSLVTWKSHKQDKVSRSSAEAEYRALADGASEAQWIHGILSDLRVRYLCPIHFFCDNKGTIALAKNPGQTGRIKHMERDRFFFKERMDEGLFDLEFVSSSDKAVDVLTKGLSNPLLLCALSKLGMGDIHTSLAGGGGGGGGGGFSEICLSLFSWV